MRNIASLFGINEDSKSKNALNNMITNMFVYPGMKEVSLKVGKYVCKDSLLGPHETVKRKFALPEGNFNTTMMRFYEWKKE